MRSSKSRFLGLLVVSACANAETQPVVAMAASPTPVVTSGPDVIPTAQPPTPVPFEVPETYRPVMDRPAIAATVAGKTILLRWLRHCERVAGPSGTITMPRLGTGSYTLPGSTGSSCSFFMDALDQDGARLWQHPVALDYSHWTLFGPWLLVSAERHVALFDVARGEIATQIRDPVLGREACLDQERGWVFVSDWDDHSKDAVVDLTKLQVRPKTAAERCPERAYSDCDEHTAVACRVHRDERFPGVVPVAGFWESGTLHSPEGDVLYGQQVGGRKLPMIVAVDPVHHTKRWSVIVPPPEFQGNAAEANIFANYCDVANGKVFFVYDQWSSHPHLAAFDLRDGSRVWDVAIPQLAAFTPTADRVYVMDPAGMHVFDARTGEPFAP